MTSLNELLQERRAAGRARTPQASLSIMDAATDALRAAGVADSSLPAGATAIDFTLPAADGSTLSLSDTLASGPVVLAFYRGGWCPYCSIELRTLQARLPEIAALGATLVAISPELPDNSLTNAEKLELKFPVLSDIANRVASSYGLVFTLPEDLRSVYANLGIDLPAANGDASFELPIPATYVIDRGGTVRWRFADPDYTKRAEPDDVIAVLRGL